MTSQARLDGELVEAGLVAVLLLVLGLVDLFPRDAHGRRVGALLLLGLGLDQRLDVHHGRRGLLGGGSGGGRRLLLSLFLLLGRGRAIGLGRLGRLLDLLLLLLGGRLGRCLRCITGIVMSATALHSDLCQSGCQKARTGDAELGERRLEVVHLELLLLLLGERARSLLLLGRLGRGLSGLGVLLLLLLRLLLGVLLVLLLLLLLDGGGGGSRSTRVVLVVALVAPRGARLLANEGREALLGVGALALGALLALLLGRQRWCRRPDSSAFPLSMT